MLEPLVRPPSRRADRVDQVLNCVKLPACPDLSSLKGREDQPFSIAWPKADLQKPTLFGPLVRLGKNTNQHRGQGLVHQDEMSFFAAAQSRELDWNKHGALCNLCFFREGCRLAVRKRQARYGYHTLPQRRRIPQIGYAAGLRWP